MAIAVPEENYLKNYCNKLDITGDFKELCKNKSVREIILNDLNKLGQQAGLMKYEQIKNIYLHPEAFSIDNELATPTMKIKRLAIREYFKSTILSLYAEISNSKSKL